jgi:hypothetical protein
MLGRRDPQTSLFNAFTQLESDAIKSMGFYAHLARDGHQIFRDEDFAAAYCANNGRPSAPPSLLAMARLLQHKEKISDAEVIERCRYDLRWKVALDLDPLSTDAPFVKSTFQLFRTRLTLHEQEGLMFAKSLEIARDRGLLPKSLRLALDSSPVRGRGAVKDTYNLLSDAIVALLRAIARARETSPEAVAEEAGLQRHLEAPSIKGSEEVNWSDPDEVSAFLGGLVADSDKALALAEQAGATGAEADLLRKIIGQDVDRGEDQTPATIRRGVAKGRSPSVSDPEMRHGCKSSGAKFNGHKAHIAVDAQSGLVTAVEMDAPGTADGEMVEALIEQTRELSGCEIEVALGDCAYSSRNALGQAKQAGVELHTKMPGHRKGMFAPGDFEVSEDRLEARCPAGHQSGRHNRTKLKDSRGSAIQHLWPEKLCGSCPLKERCTRGKRKTLVVPEDFHDRRQRERYANSPEGHQELRQRVAVEHAIGRLKNRGAGHSRYFGQQKTKAQWLWTAALANLCLIFGSGTVNGGGRAARSRFRGVLSIISRLGSIFRAAGRQRTPQKARVGQILESGRRILVPTGSRWGEGWLAQYAGFRPAL